MAAAAPGAAEPGLYERNYGFLLGLFPEGGVIEVQLVENGEIVTQLWTAEQFAAFRAAHATLMGIDYGAGFQGVPPGLGDNQVWGDVWGDFWGPPVSTNVAVPRGLPRLLICDNTKLCVYGGSGAQTGVWEHPGGCVHLFSFFEICSSVYGWTYPQGAFGVGHTFMAGTGLIFNFGAPFGALVLLDGVVLAEDPEG